MRALRLALPLAAAMALSAPALAQDAAAPQAAKPAPKKPAAKAAAKPGGERKPGELEGWNGSGALPTPRAANGGSRPPGVIAEKALPDGGLPLPREKATDNRAPVGFDQNGNMGGMFKF